MFFLKKLFNSTLQLRSGQAILGLTIGIFLAGYAVFAFQAPMQAPPGGNVPAPVNVGADAQVKQGGLWVKSLGADEGATFMGNLSVGGTMQIGASADSPACDAPKRGSFYFNTNVNKVSVCSGTAWEVFSTGVDVDADGVFAGTDCDDGDNTKWQNISCYIDNDGDGVRSTYTTTVCSGASCAGSTGSPGTDCLGSGAGAANVYQNVANVRTDADHDNYFTSAGASTQCVGGTSTFYGRAYYQDTAGNYTWCTTSVCTGTTTDLHDADDTLPYKVCGSSSPGCPGATTHTLISAYDPDCNNRCTAAGYASGDNIETYVDCTPRSGEHCTTYDHATCTGGGLTTDSYRCMRPNWQGGGQCLCSN